MADEGSGFTGEDRRVLIRSEVELSHIREMLIGVTERTAVLEKGHVSREELRQVEIDIDMLRMDKADRVDVKALGLLKLDVSEFGKEEIKTINDDLKGLRKDIEMLIRQRWFERGVVVAAMALGELILHVVFK